MSDVFKLVDWSSPIQQPGSVSATAAGQSSPESGGSSANSSAVKRSQSSSVSSSKTTTNPIEADSPSPQKPKHGSTSDIQLAELLDHPFGMPLPLFNEFNTLHPYLSLYYLDFFTAINKMNTKLFCTTTLMMSMMKAANQANKRDDEVNDDSGLSSTTAGDSAFDPARPKDLNNPVGYTIGATNILFKQRLYDDLDAFIDETDVDFRGNETLKKQLQLTTADLRFTDYIIKNVQTMRDKIQSGQSAAKLVSFKKTSSMNTFNPNSSTADGSFSAADDELVAQSAAMDFEGSDDWIRLNFKWYLYTMLASIVKEDLCARLKYDLECMLFSWAGATSSASDTSQSGGDNSSAGSASLDNEVVNIDDYIERVNNGAETPKFDTLTPKKKVIKTFL